MAQNISFQNASFTSYLTENNTSRLHFEAVNELDLIYIIRELKDKKDSGHNDKSTTMYIFCDYQTSHVNN